MKSKKIVVAVILILVLLGVCWWYFWPKQGGAIFASGTIEAVEVEVSTKVPGTVLKLFAAEGDKVNEGDILAQIDNSELSAMYDQAKGVEDQARANLDLAKKTFDRSKKLYTDGFVSQQVYDQSKAGLDGANAALKQAEAARTIAGIRLKDSTIRSPGTGYVTSKAVEAGELVSAGSAIMTVTDLSTVHIMLYVSETEVGRVVLGDAVKISVDSYGPARFEGKVTYISKQAEFTPKNIQTRKERVTQVFAVKVEVPNPDLKLKPGLPADATIKI
jgi:HlyD family secretion protein